MKVLAITQRLPDRLDEGAKFVTACDLALLSRFSEVTVLPLEGMSSWPAVTKIVADHGGDIRTLNLARGASESYSGMSFLGASLGRKVLSLLLSPLYGLPYICMRRYVAGFVGVVEHELAHGGYDAVYLDGVSLAYLLPLLERAQMPIYYRCHDVISETFMRMAEASSGVKSLILRVESKRADVLDADCGRLAVGSFCLSDGNKDYLLGRGASNVELVRPFLPKGCAPVPRVRIGNGFRLGYLGNSLYPPNRDGLEWFFDSVWTVLRARLPGLELVMAGKGTESYGKNEGVVTLGYVDSVDDFYSQVDLVLVPLFSGSGIRIKILDSLAHGVPLISTSVGAEGISISDDEVLAIADSPVEWVERILIASKVMRSWAVSEKANVAVGNLFSMAAAEEGFARVLRLEQLDAST